MAKYDKDKIIGSGTFGNVWLVKSKLSRQSYVIKEISISSLEESELGQALTEVSVLSKCKNKHIISYKETMVNREAKILSIVMEYADGGDLYTAIVKQEGVPFTEHRVVMWFVQICLALQYIHYKNIIHRDLKSQNIFLTRNKVIKIGDFGICRVLKGPEELAKTAIGTPYYLSPEICQRKPYNYKSDIWALGCVLFEMAALEHAFKAQDFIHLMTLILLGKRRELPRYCGPVLQDLVQKLLNVEPEQRPTTGEILAYPSLQPYLSEYMVTENLRDNSIMSATEASSRRGSVSNIFKDLGESCSKRKASLSSQNPKATKRTVQPLKESKPPRSRCFSTNARAIATKIISKPPLSSAENLKQKYQMTYKASGPKHTPCLDKTKSSLTVSCDTYVIPRIYSTTQFKLSKSEDTAFDDEMDDGYQTEENRIHSSNSAGMNSKGLSNVSLLQRHLKESKISETNSEVFSDISSRYLDTCSSKISNGTSHNHCQHSQCHQCMLDTLWRNRIRCCVVGTSVNTDEYLRLKSKLVLVYRGELFKKVYQSLRYDWEGSDNVTSKETFQNIVNSLTYEQVQSLPLMMQLIQLDLLMNSKQ